LNLQTANVIINVDVPWNPARLLQRFGRIDRFGQKKENIFFYNLFYPGTIEDLMYSRLHQRNNDFRELLGATPEITSEDHIRDLQLREILDQPNNPEFSYRNSLIKFMPEHNIRIHDLILNA
jgi:SNF2 family DNA or RNA helicase